MNDEQNLLASAYLDGALTSEERARAEADPDVMAAVERLGELRRALAVVEPADPARRDAAIQAALDAFDTEAAPPAPVTPLASRRFGGWLVSAAAAALVVVVVGGILAVSNSGGDDDDDGAAGGAATAGTMTAGDTPMLGDTGPTDQRDADQGAQEAEGGGAATTAAAAVPEATAAPGTTDVGSDATITATYSALLVASPEQLTQFAEDALGAGATSGAAARTSCDEGRSLGAAIYDVDGVATPVEVFLADDDSEVLAVDASTCEIVARAPAP
jgi:hypothetical protein